jgi:hypothetical protein
LWSAGWHLMTWLFDCSFMIVLCTNVGCPEVEKSWSRINHSRLRSEFETLGTGSCLLRLQCLTSTESLQRKVCQFP